jgi:hypothetical protein
MKQALTRLSPRGATAHEAAAAPVIVLDQGENREIGGAGDILNFYHVTLLPFQLFFITKICCTVTLPVILLHCNR